MNNEPTTKKVIELNLNSNNFNRLIIRHLAKDDLFNEFLFFECIFFYYFPEFVDIISYEEIERIIERLNNIIYDIDLKSGNIVSLCQYLSERLILFYDYNGEIIPDNKSKYIKFKEILFKNLEDLKDDFKNYLYNRYF